MTDRALEKQLYLLDVIRNRFTEKSSLTLNLKTDVCN